MVMVMVRSEWPDSIECRFAKSRVLKTLKQVDSWHWYLLSLRCENVYVRLVHILLSLIGVSPMSQSPKLLDAGALWIPFH